MAVELRDTIKNTNSAVFTLTLNLAGELPTSRTITIDFIRYDESTAREDIGSFRSLLLNKFNKFIQPNGWRDADITEEEWTITAVEAKITAKQEIKFDYNN